MPGATVGALHPDKPMSDAKPAHLKNRLAKLLVRFIFILSGPFKL